jgi:peptidyl-prolyl cis-trans isomerase SurA
MAKIITGMMLLAAVALQPATSPAAQLVSGIAATVNEEPITTVEVDKEAALMQRELQQLPAAERKSAVLNRLIDKKLIDQKIKELDVRVSDDEVNAAVEDVKKQNGISQQALEQALAGQGMSFPQYKKQLKDQLERIRLMSQEVRAKIQVSEPEMRAFYQQNLSRYGGEEQFHARHIFFKIDKKATPEERAKIEAQANEVLKEARSGKEFVELAKKYSTDPAAARDGGDLGTFKKEDMLPEIGETVAALKPGEVSGLVLSPAGYHIIKLEEKIQGNAKPFDEVRGEIEEILYKKKADERFAQWVKDLRSSAAIEIREK